jgi:Plectin/S10 domain
VLVAKKDFYQAAHEEIPDVPNLEVLCLMKSMRSRELVRETFNWSVIVLSLFYLYDILVCCASFSHSDENLEYS